MISIGMYEETAIIAVVIVAIIIVFALLDSRKKARQKRIAQLKAQQKEQQKEEVKKVVDEDVKQEIKELQVATIKLDDKIEELKKLIVPEEEPVKPETLKTNYYVYEDGNLLTIQKLDKEHELILSKEDVEALTSDEQKLLDFLAEPKTFVQIKGLGIKFPTMVISKLKKKNLIVKGEDGKYKKV